MKLLIEKLRNPFAKRPNISERIGKQMPRESGVGIRNRMSILEADLERLKAGNRMSNPGIQEGQGREPTEIAEKQSELERLRQLATTQSTDRPGYNPPVEVPQDKNK